MLDLAFDACEELAITGSMPDGARNTVRARVVRPEAYILIKAFALNDRVKEKDAYDITFEIRMCPNGVADLATRSVHSLLSRGLARTATKFSRKSSKRSIRPGRSGRQRFLKRMVMTTNRHNAQHSSTQRSFFTSGELCEPA